VPCVVPLGAVVFQLTLPGIALERIAVRLVLEFYVALVPTRLNVYVHMQAVVMGVGVLQPDLALRILLTKRLRHRAPELRLRMEKTGRSSAISA